MEHGAYFRWFTDGKKKILIEGDIIYLFINLNIFLALSHDKTLKTGRPSTSSEATISNIY